MATTKGKAKKAKAEKAKVKPKPKRGKVVSALTGIEARFDIPSMAKLHRTDKCPEGVTTGYAMGVTCGFEHLPGVFTKWWEGALVQIGLMTIQRICEAFNCGPSDFIIVRPDLMQGEGKALRQAREALGLSPSQFASIFSEHAGFNFGEKAVIAWEAGKAKIREGIWQAIAMALIEPGFATAVSEEEQE